MAHKTITKNVSELVNGGLLTVTYVDKSESAPLGYTHITLHRGKSKTIDFEVSVSAMLRGEEVSKIVYDMASATAFAIWDDMGMEEAVASWGDDDV